MLRKSPAKVLILPALALLTVDAAPVFAQSTSRPASQQCIREGNEAAQQAYPYGQPDFDTDPAGWEDYARIRNNAIVDCNNGNEAPDQQPDLHPGSRTLPDKGTGQLDCPGSGCYMRDN